MVEEVQVEALVEADMGEGVMQQQQQQAEEAAVAAEEEEEGLRPLTSSASPCTLPDWWS